MRFVNQSREYELQLYQGEHAKEFTVCELKDGKVEGRCQLYNRGIISLSWMMKNGKREGGITEYVKGKAVLWVKVRREGRRILVHTEGQNQNLTCKVLYVYLSVKN